MLKTIEVVFDGKTFVPTGPVDLPAGTKVTVEVPDDSGTPRTSVGAPPPPMTDEERAEWERLCRLWADAPLPWPTVDEAVAAQRSSSWRPEDGS